MEVPSEMIYFECLVFNLWLYTKAKIDRSNACLAGA